MINKIEPYLFCLFFWKLYNLAEDPGESDNLYAAQPDVVRDLKDLLETSKANGRSRP